jgi:hypothetical protein
LRSFVNDTGGKRATGSAGGLKFRQSKTPALPAEAASTITTTTNAARLVIDERLLTLSGPIQLTRAID